MMKKYIYEKEQKITCVATVVVCMIDVEKSVKSGNTRLPGISRILLVLRNDVDNLKAVDYVANLARADSKVYVLYVVDVEPIPMDDKVEREFYGKLRREGKEIVEDAINRLRSAGIDAEFYDIHIGIAAEKILKVEKGLAPDIIVMGVRGLSTFKKMFLGSISEEVTKNARTPVLLVK